MLKRLILASVLMFGCASHQTTVPKPSTPTVDSTQNTPAPPVGLAKQPAPPPSDKQVFKGDLWEIRASYFWTKAVSEDEDTQLLLFSQNNKAMAVLMKWDYVDSLDMFTTEVASHIRDMGGRVVTARGAYVNTRKAVELESLMLGGVVWSWTFVTGAEGYVFNCGGDLATYDENRMRCTELLKGFYIGKAP